METRYQTEAGSYDAEHGLDDSQAIVDMPTIGDGPPGPAFALIQFQNGPIKEHGVNGVQVVDVLEICLHRMQSLNEHFRCRENSLVITKIEEAILWDRERTRARTAAKVEGTDSPR